MEEAYQIDFLKSDDILEENKRGILKTFYVNKEKIFLVLYQLHMKICSEFFYLDPKTLKFAVLYELNKVQTLLSDLEKRAVLNARVTVFYKSFFLERMAQIFGSYFLQSEFKRLYQTLLLNLNKCGSCGIIKCFYCKKFEISCTSCRTDRCKNCAKFFYTIEFFYEHTTKDQ